VLGVLLLGIVLVVLGGVVGLALTVALRAGAQSAADAAAVACAARVTVATLVDARGVVYGTQVEVDAAAGPEAAAVVWGDNLALLPGLGTAAFAATPSGADCTVSAVVTGGPASRLPGGPPARWPVVAEAAASGSG